MVALPKGPAKFFRLSPDEREALGGFAVHRGDARARLDVNYSALGPMVEERLARSRYPVVTIATLEKRLQYGCSKRADVDPVGLPILRMSNMQPDGWDLRDLKYVELTDKERDLWLLEEGDILFNRTNSKELVGKCEVFREPGEWVFASYLMRLTVDSQQASPDFVSAYLSSPGGRAQIERESRQIIGMTNINAEEIRTLRIPLPKPDIQAALLAKLDASRAARDSGLAAAAATLQSFDQFVFDALGISVPNEPRDVFAIRASQLAGPLTPSRYLALQSEQKMGLRTSLGQFVEIVEDRCNPEAEKPDEEWDWIRIDDLPNFPSQIESVRTMLGAEMSGTFLQSRTDDILVARLGPTIQNAKSVLCPEFTRQTVVSPEFLVLRAKEGCNPRAILPILRTALFREIMYLRTRGATPSRFRLDSSDLLDMPFPKMTEQQQTVIAAESEHRQSEARRLRAEARAGWAAARQAFEEALLRPAA